VRNAGVCLKEKQAMTSSQKAKIAKIEARLRDLFEDAKQSMTKPGRTRGWFLPFLESLLKNYYRLRKTRIDGVRLTNLLGPNPRERFLAILAECTDRDPKTRSRWAAAMANAVKNKVKSRELRVWLANGGGVAGRS
jgi:hypothetical protein